MAFSAGVEALNLVMRARQRKRQLAAGVVSGGPGIDRPPPVAAFPTVAE